MNLKHTVAVALIIVLTVLVSGSLADTDTFPVKPAVLAEGSLSKEDAVAIAKNEIITRESLVLTDFQNYNIVATAVTLESGENAWVVMLDELFCGTDALVTMSASDATILDYQSTNGEIIAVFSIQWFEKKGGMTAWSVEDKALYDWMSGRSDEYELPGEDHISKEEAGSIALSVMKQTATADELSYAFKHFSYTDGRPDQYVWVVIAVKNGKETYIVYVSAINGDVLEVFKPSNFG